MATNISVKIRRTKVIELLKAKLAEQQQELSRIEASNKTLPQRKVQVAKDILKALKAGKVTLKGASYGSNGHYEITVKCPSGQSDFGDFNSFCEQNTYMLQQQASELANIIRILELSEDEFVSTGTYKNLVEYL